MVEVVVEEIDETVPERQAEVKVQTLGRGRGQGAYGILDWPTKKANRQHTWLNTASSLVQQASRDTFWQSSTIGGWGTWQIVCSMP